MVEPTIKLSSRFYEQKYPGEQDLVLVQVKDIVENGAYVRLIEYNNIEGLITPNEFSKQVNLKNAYKALKVGRTETAIVLKVDSEKGYIDLSKKKVPIDQVRAFEDKVAKAKEVNSILHTVAESCQIDIDKLYETIVWPLNKKYGNAHDAFKTALTDQGKILADYGMTPEVKEKLMHEIKRRLSPKPVSIRADFKITCAGYDGIDGVKEALRAGEKHSNEIKLKCHVVAAPLYKITTQYLDKNAGVQRIKEALALIEEAIKAKNGTYEHHPESQLFVLGGDKDEKRVIDEIEEQAEENKDDNSEDTENNSEGMGDGDLDGVDTAELDRQEELKKKAGATAKVEADEDA